MASDQGELIYSDGLNSKEIKRNISTAKPTFMETLFPGFPVFEKHVYEIVFPGFPTFGEHWFVHVGKHG
jgi:hypothetical protein